MAADLDFEAVLDRKERGWEERLREMYAQILRDKEGLQLEVLVLAIYTACRS